YLFDFFFFFFFFFFFSSRRRHTRCLSDWSSDVCSSDLEYRMPSLSDLEMAFRMHYGSYGLIGYTMKIIRGAARIARSHPQREIRSEERRVGKECRSRGET